MTYISADLRRQVWAISKGNCEYCLINSQYTLKIHEVDHIRAEKHGGATTFENLSLSCFDCNRQKGSDLSSVDPLTDEVVALFHPRREKWDEHFRLADDGTLEGKTAQGRVTVILLEFNNPERVTLRAALMSLGRYPDTGDFDPQ
jgi:hypothetical protein